MKKILAALLVVVMVVSLFPATVFAANSVCPVAANHYEHSKAHCDKLGVKYTQFADPVKAVCGRDGYTTYKCECGVYFADDIVPMPEAEHEAAMGAKPVVNRIEATCSKYGMAAFYDCVYCDELFPEYLPFDVEAEDENAPAGAIEKAAHKLASGSCTAETRTCTVCGEAVKVTAEEHVFNYNDPHAITKAPGTCGHGEATFKCLVEGCGYAKTVAVAFDGHNEDSDQLEEVEEVKATCTKTGVKAHYKCEECNAIFAYNEDGEFVPVTAEELVIPVTHAFGEEPTLVKLPTCTEYGADYYFCELCGKSEVKNEVAPLGCTTYEEAVAHDADKELVEKDGKWLTIVKATGCTDQTTYTWTCHEECYCDADPDAPAKAICGKEMTKKDAAKGHTEKTVKVPATVEYPYEYTLVFCTDPNCELARLEDVQDVTVDGKTYTLNVSVKVDGGDVYEMLDAEKAAVKFIKVTKVTEKTVEKCGAHYFELNSLSKPSCTAAGNAVYVCTSITCGYTHKAVTIAKLGHDYSDYSQYECEKETKILCSRCGAESKVAKADAAHKIDFDKFIETLEVPNCRRPAGDYYECEYCGMGAKGWGIVDTNSENYKKYTYTSIFNSLEEAKAAHSGNGQPGTGNFTVVKTYPGDCETAGKTEYTHSSCGKKFFVIDETTGHHIAPEGTTYYEEADCFHGAGYVDYDCARCGEEVKAADPLPHILSEIVEDKAATCTEDGNIRYATCSRECCLYDPDPTDDKDEKLPGYFEVKTEQVKVDGLFKDVEVPYPLYSSNPEVVVIPAFEHKNSIVSSGVVAENCTTAGYEHFYCTIEGCDYEYVDNYAKATGHKKAAKATETNPDCITDGYKYFKCENAGCTGDDGIAGTADDGKATAVEVKPALGHINAAGQVFYDKCTDTTADRVCVRASCVHPLDAEGKRTIGKSCDMSDKEYVHKCCNSDAYWIEVCNNGCGKTNVELVEKTEGHLFAWGEYAGCEGYVDADEIAYWMYMYTELNPWFLYFYGNEAILAYTPATHEKAGSITFTCAHECCGEVVTMPIMYVPVAFTVDVDNALVPGASDVLDVNGEVVRILPADGDIIAIDINMSAYNTGVWGFNFEFNYDAAAMNYLGYAFKAGDIFTTTKFNHYYSDEDILDDYDLDNDGIYAEVIGVDKNANGTVKVAAYNDKKVDTTINGTKTVVTLYFQVDAYYKQTVLGTEYEFKASELWFEIDNGSITNAEGGYVAQDFNAWNYIEIAQLMDANCDDCFDIYDLYAAVDAIVSDSYLDGADIDKDGDVDVDDLTLMSDYMVADGSVDALIKVLLSRKAWTAPEGFVAA